ncbi:hypothetical protein [Streptomyces lanatus]|uniref:Secreted protein n=1 Tax=Streptomyces lanatus TaxID=66900 RepID=A0ABV1XHU2_9ACTN|nr:hypothetical protein [Streptomyces lanatus]GHG93904.1 hypothetical protein GCM10018780_16770 [Streptomyces lanatus]
MPKKFAVITALALTTVVSTAGIASAGGYGNGGNGGSNGGGKTTTVKGGDGFSSSPVVVNAPQQGVLIVNGTLIDGRCLAPWSNGSVLGGVAAPNSKYASCNTAKVEQGRGALHESGLLM